MAAAMSVKRRKSVAGSLVPEVLLPLLPAIVPALTSLLNASVRNGCLPQEWALGYIVPVFKAGGNPALVDDYRPITIGSLPAKILAVCLNTRLSGWAEGGGKRAQGQAGFRAERRCADNVLVLRTMIELQRHAAQGLYCCFVDFKKAYDCVPRDKLWAKLRAVGVTAWLMRAVQTLYADVPVCVRGPSGFSAVFSSLVGLRQGCPLSPTLFGLYVDDLEVAVLAAAGAELPRLRGEALPPLLYADDLALLAASAQGLQRQLAVLEEYCSRWGLTVNLVKTEVVVFRGDVPRAGWRYAGGLVPVRESFVYLGHLFLAAGSLSATGGLRAERAAATTHAMRRRLAELGCALPLHACEMFDILVRPGLEFGAELWAPEFLLGWREAPLDTRRGHLPSRKVHLGLVRRALGVSAHGTPHAVVLAETGRWPLECRFAKLIASFWGRLVALGDDHLVRRAFLAGLELAAEQALAGVELRQRCWAAQAQAVLRDLGVVAADGVGLVAAAPAAEVALQSAYVTALTAADAVKTQFYREHVRGGITAATYRPQPYLRLRNREARRALAQLRVGTHWLHVDTGRRAQPFRPREQRTCHLCTGQVEDELHMLLVCPLYAPDRERAGDLLAGAPTLRSLLGGDQAQQGKAADFVLACWRRRRDDLVARAAAREAVAEG
jgi:hypothetical protein